MTEKELKKLNRYQLLEMLILQTERAEQLEQELRETRQKLEAHDLRIAELGSIAEASLQLSGIFEAAQRAADMYVEEAKKRAENVTETQNA